MITVDDALAQLFSLVTPMPDETVPLAQAVGRVLAHDAIATRDQPPFAASAMDGYALRANEAQVGAGFEVVGEAAAGHAFTGPCAPGQAIRIFTGAPVPDCVDHVVIQEDVSRAGSRITLTDRLGKGANIRPSGGDFHVGDRLRAPRILRPSDIALLASMNIANVSVARRPDVALMSTGDELVMPGDTPGPDQIIASNTFGLKALLECVGARARILPIARDRRASLEAAFDLARDADLVITIGGASVGDHDIVGDVAADRGFKRAFYKISMRPGKPLMAGRLGKSVMLGLPGNPVSAMICGHVFAVPLIAAMLGLKAARSSRLTARLATPLPGNGPREHYMRAFVENGRITAEDNQDSSLLTILADANALLIRTIDDSPRETGDKIEYLPI